MDLRFVGVVRVAVLALLVWPSGCLPCRETAPWGQEQGLFLLFIVLAAEAVFVTCYLLNERTQTNISHWSSAPLCQTPL